MPFIYILNTKLRIRIMDSLKIIILILCKKPLNYFLYLSICLYIHLTKQMRKTWFTWPEKNRNCEK